MNKLTVDDLLPMASGVFLTEILPIDWRNLDQDEMVDYIEVNRAVQYEELSGVEVMRMINDTAAYLLDQLNNIGVTTREYAD